MYQNKNFLFFTITALVCSLLIYLIWRNLAELLSYRVMTIASGSMEPALGKGSLVLVKSSAEPIEYQADQLVSFVTPRTKQLVTHRVLNSTQLHDQQLISTKGDANPYPDPWILTEVDVVGRVTASIPWLGYLVMAIKTPIGLLLGVVMPATVLVISQVRQLALDLRGA